MKFTIEKLPFVSNLFIPQKVAEKNSSIQPILSNVQIEAFKSGKITIKATDMATSVFSTVECDVIKSGKVTISGKILYNLIKNFSNNLVDIERVNNQLMIKSGKSVFEINTMRDEDFPAIHLPEEKLFKSFESSIFVELINKTIFSVSTDDTKQHLTGIFVAIDEKIAKAVSTDGHRLSMSEYAYEGDFELPKGIIIPKKGASDIKDLLSSKSDNLLCTFEKDLKLLSVKNGNTILSVKIIDSKFPPYEQVIPKYDTDDVVIPKEIFSQAINRINLLSDGSESGVIFHLEEDNLVLTGTDTIKGKAKEEIDIDYQGEEFKIAFNIRFLEQIIKNIEGKEFIVNFGGEKTAALVKAVDNSSFLAVIMPLKL